MELYNPIIREVEALAGASTPKRYAYDPADAWEDTGAFELVMLRDAAFELGGSGKSAVNFTCVTSSAELVPGDEIVVCGPDLDELNGDDTEQAFRAIQDMDFVKYHVFPKGYMIRTSSESSREQVRISREAVQKGMTFRRIGADFIRQYKQNRNILAVKLLFITAPEADYAALTRNAKTVKDITMSLTKILEGMPTDCGSCNLKAICDEVEGMRELHFGKEHHTTE